MSRWTVAALAAELVLAAVLLALTLGQVGRTAGWAAALGAVVVLLLAMPSLKLLLWGRERSHVEFMAALVGSIFGKMVVVGLALVWVARASAWPLLPFIWGLMGGWIASFTFQGLVLKRTLRRPAAPLGG